MTLSGKSGPSSQQRIDLFSNGYEDSVPKPESASLSRVAQPHLEEVVLNGPSETLYGEVGHLRVLEDCPCEKATTYEIPTMLGLEDSYAKGLKKRLSGWIRDEENPNGCLIITTEPKKVMVHSLSGEPIVQVSILAARIASEVRSTAFKK